MNIKLTILACAISTTLAWSSVSLAQENTPLSVANNANLTVKQLIEYALSQDANREKLYSQSLAMRETGVASASLMDPKVKMGVGGLPVDSLGFDDDPMTNIAIGFMQQFSRGNTLALQQQQWNQQADGMTQQLALRELEVANSITKLWLELGYQQQAEKILLENQSLMAEMAQYIETNYAIGKSETQDLLQAQLQVSQLDEKRQANLQMQRKIMSQLSEWLGVAWLADSRPLAASNQLPWPKLDVILAKQAEQTDHYSVLKSHPMVQVANAAIAGNHTQVALANEAYKPELGVEVMYGNRQANGMGGQPASDLVSAYLTVDVPLFTSNRQDRKHAAAQYQLGAAKLQRDQVISQMNAQVNALLVDASNLNQRVEHYQTSLLKQAKARTKAVERGYENNTAQFNDVILATRDELVLSLERTRLLTDLHITYSNLATLLGGFDYQVTQPNVARPQANR